MTNARLDAEAERRLRDLAPLVLGSIVRRFGDFAAAEDAVQEALVAAARQWPSAGLPDHPRAWLIGVAMRRFIDRQRSDSARRQRESAAAAQFDAAMPASDNAEEADDALVLLFMCAHPALTRSSAIALTLRAVGGLTTAEIANAFLVPEPTMAQRISRAKQSIKASGVAFRLLTGEDRAERLRSVLHVLYLIFSEGYTSSSGGRLQRVELSNEAIRLTRALHDLLPDDAEVMGLLALMILTDARRPARTGLRGELIPLAKQDRTRWNRDAIAEGIGLVSAALARGPIGSYQLQAAIAAVHDEASAPENTDWPQILALYALLVRISNNPMVVLNHAVAAAMVHGPKTGLELLLALDSDARVAGHHRLSAVRAHLFEMAGDRDAAIAHYRLAAGRTSNAPERNYLLTQAAGLAERAH